MATPKTPRTPKPWGTGTPRGFGRSLAAPAPAPRRGSEQKTSVRVAPWDAVAGQKLGFGDGAEEVMDTARMSHAGEGSGGEGSGEDPGVLDPSYVESVMALFGSGEGGGGVPGGVPGGVSGGVLGGIQGVWNGVRGRNGAAVPRAPGCVVCDSLGVRHGTGAGGRPAQAGVLRRTPGGAAPSSRTWRGSIQPGEPLTRRVCPAAPTVAVNSRGGEGGGG